MTTGASPYVVPVPTDTDPSATVLETEIVAAHTMVDIGGGVMAMAETFNGAIPGPTFFLNVGDTVIVRLINELDHPLSIHWHGIELANSADGTEVTQAGVLPAFGVPPPPPAPAGGTYLYKFKVPRPGLFWYHPHSHGSTNRVFRGLYGMIVVAHPDEPALIAANTIPGAADTQQLVLSDITVCKAPGMNDAATYDPALPWAGGGALPVQNPPTPVNLCEIGMNGATDEHGDPALVSYNDGDIPSLIRTGQTNEGQTVLTNGMNVGPRAGCPQAPGLIDPAAFTLPVQTNQRLRLQIANCAAIRYFRLLLTTNTGAPVDLVRIGGEGGLLENARIEGGNIGGFDTKYAAGEILLPAGTRADVVATIPAGATDLTLWTLDYQRTGPTNPGNWAFLPTVPVMHLDVTGVAPVAPAIVNNTPIGPAIAALPAADGTLLNLPTFPAAGMNDPDIEITTPPGINGTQGSFEMDPYPTAPHIASSRWAEGGKTIDLTVTNTSQAHHPFHLHGFSFQPLSLTRPAFPTFNWTWVEFRDNIDIPAGYTLAFRVRLEDRELVDGVTFGGALGRWLFHCHIFFHHHQGMISELVVTGADGSEKPNVDVNGSWAYAASGGTVTRTGTYQHPDGIAMTLSATTAAGVPIGNILPAGPVLGPGNWSWSFSGPDQTSYVYVTATDTEGRSDQTVFRIKIGGADDGADNGDPHIHTVDGNRYDFQAAGEFTLLRGADEGLEVQARQTPVIAANPITDAYSGLRTCVCVNTAVAARVGSHRIAYQPTRDPKQLQLFIDGRRVEIPREAIELDEHRLTAQKTAGGATAIRVDYASGAVLIVTPNFWTSYGVWYLNISIAHTQADRGIMGRIAHDSWLPALPNGANVGPMPVSLGDRYTTLYRTFADAWRVTAKTSLFVYEPGTSTDTFTDRNWPAEKPPCKLLPQFEIPGANPPRRGIDVKDAERICSRVTIDGLRQDCVFDVATTGDKEFALGYEQMQELRLRATAVQIVAKQPRSKPGEEVTVTAIVSNLYRDAKEWPRGEVRFFVDGREAGTEKLDERGSAHLALRGLEVGEHRVRAEYAGGGDRGHQSSGSPNLILVVAGRTEKQPKRRKDY
jgi:FtsP/CotA-like multicopper oxidase with cupredoxin domain